MIAALMLPALLDRLSDRPVMLIASAFLPAGLVAAATAHSYAALLALWFLLGIGYAAAQTPSGRLLRRSAHAEDRPAIFATHFAYSHGAWLISYPLAGWAGAQIGLAEAELLLAALAGASVLAAWRLWPAASEDKLRHAHGDLPPDHPHWSEGQISATGHSHAVIVDPLHRHWPHSE